MAAKLLLLFALCVFPALISAHQLGPPFLVRGRVYCDTCRFGFETPATIYLKGARVKIECRERDSLNVTYTKEGVTDSTGTYRILAEEDHKDELCRAVLVSSPKPNCAKADVGRNCGQVELTNANGILSNVRHANNMGFLLDEPLGVCAALRKVYLLDEGDRSI